MIPESLSVALGVAPSSHCVLSRAINNHFDVAPSRVSTDKSMKLTLAILLLLAAITAASETKQGCQASFYFVYTDTLGNKYGDVQGKELREIEQHLKKKQHGEICLAAIRDGATDADYIFVVTAETRKRIWQGSEVFYTNYSLEVRLFSPPKTLLHTFARVPTEKDSGYYRHRTPENQVIIGLIDEAANWLDLDLKYRAADGRRSPHGVAGTSPDPTSVGTQAPESRTTFKKYDHGTDESSFGLMAHVKATEQRATQCISTVDIGNSEVEVYNFEHPDSCLGFSNLSAGMNFKARFSLICQGVFDDCTMKNVDGAKAGILIYLPPALSGGDAIIQEYKIVGTRELPSAPQTGAR